MSYQATYSTRINTRIASDALKNIGKNIIQMSGRIRVGSEKCTLAMDSLMNKRNGFLVDIHSLKANFNNCYNDMLKNSPSIGMTQAKVKAISELPGLKNFAELTSGYKTISNNPNLIKGISGKIKVDSIINESFAQIEKTMVDVQTVLVTKAVTECRWNIIDSASEIDAQTIVAQNKDGNVLALNITGDNINFDIAGMCDETCVDHAKVLFKKLDEMGLKSQIESGFKHNKPSGGILLSNGKKAEKIIQKAKNKRRKAIKISIPVKPGKANYEERVKNRTQDKLREL